MEYRHRPVARQSGPDFSATVPGNGYAWWYVDALSDCGRHGLTLIAMLGCVFSPWYAAARRRGVAEPLEHSALNVALYGGGGRRWAMTERGALDVQQSESRLAIGRSTLHWDGRELVVEVDEREAPWPRPLRGRLRVRPAAVVHRPFTLDAAQRHTWWPIAPRCRVELEFSAPALRWSGHGYLDANEGRAPLEDDFDGWNWSRGSTGASTRVFYDTVPRAPDAAGRRLSLAFDDAGRVREVAAPPSRRLPPTPWGIARETRCDAGAAAEVLGTLESGPFYSRSLVRTQVGGAPMTAFHESVSLRRFAARWVQALLPVRLPRHPIARP
jgi:carotenoid 1,2-hydratase